MKKKLPSTRKRRLSLSLWQATRLVFGLSSYLKDLEALAPSKDHALQEKIRRIKAFREQMELFAMSFELSPAQLKRYESLRRKTATRKPGDDQMKRIIGPVAKLTRPEKQIRQEMMSKGFKLLYGDKHDKDR